ncbi:hypothetical protein SLEP1_g4025 [Rubroshorea leprosula]|uniref:Uncharacterized protein n=1 Tax=Rubroshorea leprosula TaxID=152421 RepID=A0AAV5HW71_9ROSI|nr:hypothetical protein SLEP1_g4025 [Rubroshorea leprosula]
MRRGMQGASFSRQQVDLEGKGQRPLCPLIQGPRREQPIITQPPLDDDQYTDDDATMEEDTKERNLEAELDAEFAMLDPELDAQLEEKLSRAVPKTRRGMDKGDDAPADPSQRKVLSLNRQGTFSHERFGRTTTVIWKYLYDELVLFWSSWPEKKKMVAWENFQAVKRGGVRPTPLKSYLLTHTTRLPDAPEDAPPTWICPQAEQTYNDAHKNMWTSMGQTRIHGQNGIHLSRRRWLDLLKRVKRERCLHYRIQQSMASLGDERYHREYHRWRPALRGDSKSTCAYLASNIL